MAIWSNDYVKINRYTRPGMKLNARRKGVLHYTANYGATAKNHVTYFGKTLIEQNERLPESKKRFASAHIFVDKKEAICIIPLDEVAYAANDIQKYVNGQPYRGIPELKPNANFLSISVEMCQEKDGSFHPDTIARTEDVFVELCKMYGWDPLKDIVRHYDITHKNCPAPWVKDGQKFIDFKNRVNNKLKGKKPSQSKPTPSKPKSKTIEQLANEVIAGKHGSGDARKKSLGSQYATVQKLVNEKLGAKPKPAEKTIDQLVKETLAGKHGNGEARKKSLGKNYQAVQDIINGKSKPASKPASKPKSSGSGKHGKLKIVGVKSAAIVMDRPDRNKAKNLGAVKLGSTLPLNGSVRGKNSDTGYWEVEFKGKLGYITGKFGKQV